MSNLFHVSYLQDCGYGAVMECVVLVNAESKQKIRELFPKIAREQNPGIAIQEAYDSGPTEIHLPGELVPECPICIKEKV